MTRPNTEATLHAAYNAYLVEGVAFCIGIAALIAGLALWRLA